VGKVFALYRFKRAFLNMLFVGSGLVKRAL